MDLHTHYKAVRSRLNAGRPKVVEKPKAAPEPAPEPAPQPMMPLDHIKPVPKFDLIRGIPASDETKGRILPILERHRITWKDVCGRKQTARYVHIRSEIYIALKANGWSLPQIGRLVGKRDHTTVLNSIRRFVNANLTSLDFEVCEVVEMDPVRYLYWKMQLKRMREEHAQN